MTGKKNWKLEIKRPNRPAGPEAPSAGKGQGRSAGGMSLADKAQLAARAFDGVTSIIRTISEERRKWLELDTERQVALKLIDQAMKHDEEETKRAIAQCQAEIERFRTEADLERERIFAETDSRRRDHEYRMEELRNRHEKEMRFLDIIERNMEIAMAMYDKYRRPEFGVIITEGILDKMNGTLMMLTEALGGVGGASAAIDAGSAECE